jgi:hypothetical protein
MQYAWKFVSSEDLKVGDYLGDLYMNGRLILMVWCVSVYCIHTVNYRALMFTVMSLRYPSTYTSACASVCLTACACPSQTPIDNF